MNNAHLNTLEQALALSPDNYPLRMTLIRAYFESHSFDKALALLNYLGSGDFIHSEDQVLAAEIYLANNNPREALNCLLSREPNALITKSKVLLELDQVEQARDVYRSAVENNSTLEDASLAGKLGAKTVKQHHDNGKLVRLKVISNDNTNKPEVARILTPREDRITFSDVGGLEAVKHQIHKKIILPFQKPSLYKRFRKKVGGGILLYGPPGCGKTFLARATAGECNARFFNVVISDVLDMYIGESESKLYSIFDEARADSPSVIFFDEVEALAAKRQHSREATSSKLVSQFLSEMDGFAQDNNGVLVLAATNVPWAIDPAFRRPGRFDRIVFIAPPDFRARVEILNVVLTGRPGGDSIDVESLAGKTAGFSGADLSNLIESAVDEAIDDSIDSDMDIPLQSRHIEKVLEQVRPTTLEWLTTARNYARYAKDTGQYNDVMDFLNKYGKNHIEKKLKTVSLKQEF